MDTLQNVVAQNLTDFTVDIIRMELNTPSASSHTWIVAEDIDDVNVYEKFVLLDKVSVHPSTDYPAGEKGCQHVERIVGEILSISSTANVIGIRDHDYTRYECTPHVFPPNIFVTDERDIEIMMFNAPSVKASLNNWSNMMLQKLDEAITYTRFMGYFRICNHLCHLGCNFKKKVRLSKVWDVNAHCFVENWKEELLQKFLDNCGNSEPLFPITNEEEFEWFVLGWELEQEPWQFVCQGHDTVSVLSLLMINNSLYNEKEMMRRMTQAYSIVDFRNTTLYSDMNTWATNRHINVFVE